MRMVIIKNEISCTESVHNETGSVSVIVGKKGVRNW